MCNVYSVSGSIVETKCYLTPLITAGEKKYRPQTLGSVECGLSQHLSLHVAVTEFGIQGFDHLCEKLTPKPCELKTVVV